MSTIVPQSVVHDRCYKSTTNYIRLDPEHFHSKHIAMIKGTNLLAISNLEPVLQSVENISISHSLKDGSSCTFYPN